MNTLAVVLEAPERLALSRLELDPAGRRRCRRRYRVERHQHRHRAAALVRPDAAVPRHGLSAGARLRVGRPRRRRRDPLRWRVGERVFVPGARCFGEVRGLFGGAAARLVVPAARVVPIDERSRRAGRSAGAGRDRLSRHRRRRRCAGLIVGHGVLGRLLARLAIAAGGEPRPSGSATRQRAGGADGYRVIDPDRRYAPRLRVRSTTSAAIGLLDTLIARLAPAARSCWPASTASRCPSPFRRPSCARPGIRVAAEWRRADLVAVKALVETGALSLDGLITHRRRRRRMPPTAYRTAFDDPACLKMVLDWRACA